MVKNSHSQPVPLGMPRYKPRFFPSEGASRGHSGFRPARPEPPTSLPAANIPIGEPPCHTPRFAFTPCLGAVEETTTFPKGFKPKGLWPFMSLPSTAYVMARFSGTAQRSRFERYDETGGQWGSAAGLARPGASQGHRSYVVACARCIGADQGSKSPDHEDQILEVWSLGLHPQAAVAQPVIASFRARGPRGRGHT
jgi:hypothetical protein